MESITVQTADGWAATLTGGAVEITDPSGRVAGNGLWFGRIEGCAADIDEAVYDELDGLIRRELG